MRTAPSPSTHQILCSGLLIATPRAMELLCPISPLSMLNSSGSSSSDVERNFLPKEVKRWASYSGPDCPSFGGSIVRNLYNLKIFPSFPGRSCVKSTGRPSLMRTKMAVIKRTGERTIVANNAHRKSCGRLMNLSYRPYGLCFIFPFPAFDCKDYGSDTTILCTHRDTTIALNYRCFYPRKTAPNVATLCMQNSYQISTVHTSCMRIKRVSTNLFAPQSTPLIHI